MTLEELRDYNSLETQSLQKSYLLKNMVKVFKDIITKRLNLTSLFQQYPKKLMSLFLKFNINLK